MSAGTNGKPALQRLRLEIRGIVQGVGYRPFVYACARDCYLTGFVGNENGGVFVEIEGVETNLLEFQRQLRENAPALSHITSIESCQLSLKFDNDFRIATSEARIGENTLVSPDVGICADCSRELFDKSDRRFRYPFINCTNCGPRFTIIKDLPYDRPQTTMSAFRMCGRCTSEYENPLDRRFHAEPNACSECGPRVWFQPNLSGDLRRANEIFDEDAILAAQKSLSEGDIVAIKGVGGFHLACDARSDTALKKLRERKGRIDKPFAVMVRNLKTAESFAEISSLEAELLSSKEHPIVLLRKKQDSEISGSVAPGNLFVGVMLPYSPLHHLLFNSVESRFHNLDTFVMTSGNLTDEPIVKDNSEALEKLSGLADTFLLHDREIHVQCDDSLIRVAGRGTRNADPKSQISDLKSQILVPIRRSRGYAPFPVELPRQLPPVLAVGGELKATFCLAKDEFAVMSQHIGDMENLETLQAFERSLEHMRKLFRIEPEVVACDKHPAYLSSRWARENLARVFKPGTALVEIQHHHAHVASVMADNGLDGSEKVIGFAFDGTGYGEDGAIWGGEVLLADYFGFERLAHLRNVPLAGGDAAIKRPYRAALGYLWQAGVEWDDRLPCIAACPETERRILLKQFENDFNVVPSSSIGRLFDAVASLAGVRQTITYEAQAAIEFEALLDEKVSDAYEFDLNGDDTIEIDPANLIRAVARDVSKGVSTGEISAKFNNAVADVILRLALNIRERENIDRVALSGGCFQNVALLQAGVSRLRENNFEVFTHGQVPPNDGGLALGQAVIAGVQAMSK